MTVFDDKNDTKSHKLVVINEDLANACSMASVYEMYEQNKWVTLANCITVDSLS